MGGTPLTNEVAIKALHKLEAQDVSLKGAAHPTYAVIHEGRIVATTGLRHSSKRDIPVPHVKRNLNVSAAFVLDLARCPKSRDDYLRQIGELPEIDSDNPEPASS
jgi:hypothetical protein